MAHKHEISDSLPLLAAVRSAYSSCRLLTALLLISCEHVNLASRALLVGLNDGLRGESVLEGMT